MEFNRVLHDPRLAPEDLVVWKGRKFPLTVVAVGEGSDGRRWIDVEGPRGGGPYRVTEQPDGPPKMDHNDRRVQNLRFEERWWERSASELGEAMGDDEYAALVERLRAQTLEARNNLDYPDTSRALADVAAQTVGELPRDQLERIARRGTDASFSPPPSDEDLEAIVTDLLANELGDLPEPEETEPLINTKDQFDRLVGGIAYAVDSGRDLQEAVDDAIDDLRSADYLQIIDYSDYVSRPPNISFDADEVGKLALTAREALVNEVEEEYREWTDSKFRKTPTIENITDWIGDAFDVDMSFSQLRDSLGTSLEEVHDYAKARYENISDSYHPWTFVDEITTFFDQGVTYFWNSWRLIDPGVIRRDNKERHLIWVNDATGEYILLQGFTDFETQLAVQPTLDKYTVWMGKLPSKVHRGRPRRPPAARRYVVEDGNGAKEIVTDGGLELKQRDREVLREAAQEQDPRLDAEVDEDEQGVPARIGGRETKVNQPFEDAQVIIREGEDPVPLFATDSVKEALQFANDAITQGREAHLKLVHYGASENGELEGIIVNEFDTEEASESFFRSSGWTLGLPLIPTKQLGEAVGGGLLSSIKALLVGAGRGVKWGASSIYRTFKEAFDTLFAGAFLILAGQALSILTRGAFELNYNEKAGTVDYEFGGEIGNVPNLEEEWWEARKAIAHRWQGHQDPDDIDPHHPEVIEERDKRLRESGDYIENEGSISGSVGVNKWAGLFSAGKRRTYALGLNDTEVGKFIGQNALRAISNFSAQGTLGSGKNLGNVASIANIQSSREPLTSSDVRSASSFRDYPLGRWEATDPDDISKSVRNKFRRMRREARKRYGYTPDTSSSGSGRSSGSSSSSSGSGGASMADLNDIWDSVAGRAMGWADDDAAGEGFSNYGSGDLEDEVSSGLNRTLAEDVGEEVQEDIDDEEVYLSRSERAALARSEAKESGNFGDSSVDWTSWDEGKMDQRSAIMADEEISDDVADAAEEVLRESMTIDSAREMAGEAHEGDPDFLPEWVQDVGEDSGFFVADTPEGPSDPGDRPDDEGSLGEFDYGQFQDDDR